jgi:hypothetical protein
MGVRGNSHFPMADLNNKEIAALLEAWLHHSPREEAVGPRSIWPKTSNKMIQKELAFLREWSGTVTVPGAKQPLRNPAPPALWPSRGLGGGGANRRRNRMEDSVKLTDTNCGCWQRLRNAMTVPWNGRQI